MIKKLLAFRSYYLSFYISNLKILANDSEMSVSADMSSSEKSNDRERLFGAARNGRLKEVLDLSNKFNNDVDVMSWALVRSCEGGHLDVVKWFVENSAADVNYNNKDVWGAPLTVACYYDHLDVVKYLVEKGSADVNLPDSRGDAPLTEACYYVSTSVSMYLLSDVRDLNVNVADRYGNTALHYVIWCSKDDDTKLHVACDKGDVTEVERLVYAKSHKINIQNNVGNTPLHRACENGNCSIVETLMLAGADETIRNDDEDIPAHLARREGHVALLKFLDRFSLQQAMLDDESKLKFAVIFLIMLTMTLRRHRQMMTEKWYHTLTTFRIILTIKKLTKSNVTKTS